MEYHLPPPLGHAVQFPFWVNVAGYGAGAPEVSRALQNGYPRIFLHKYVRDVSIITYPR